MKKLIPLYILTLLFNACTEVVEVSVPNSEPRLVVEAQLSWFKGTDGAQQKITLSKTTPYFSENRFTPVNGALVSVTDTNNSKVFSFIDQGNGNYTCNNFEPVLNHKYKLHIDHENMIYTAEQNLVPVAPIKEITQEPGLIVEENTLLTLSLDDPEEQVNYYHCTLNDINFPVPFHELSEDEFTNGNEIKLFFGEEFIKGSTVDFELRGIDESYYNYLLILLTLSQADNGGPFSSPPVELRGNINNTTNPDAYPYGYFSISESDQKSFTLSE